MRKLIALATCLCLLLSLGANTFAAEITINGTQSTTTTVTYGVETSYVITVPDTVSMNEDGYGEAQYSVTNVCIPSGSTLMITVNSNNAADGKWYLTNTADVSSKLEYEIIASDWSSNIIPGAETAQLRFPSGYNDFYGTVVLNLLDEARMAGTYQDIWNFTVEVGYLLYGDYTETCSATGRDVLRWNTYLPHDDFDKYDQDVNADIYAEYGISIEPISAEYEDAIVTLYGFTPEMIHQNGPYGYDGLGETTCILYYSVTTEDGEVFVYASADDEVALEALSTITIKPYQIVSKEIWTWVNENFAEA